jgi:preprotein translocase subunit SecE
MTSEIADHDDQDERPRRRSGPVSFFKEVRAEGRKVTWASRQETIVSTVMVVLMVVIMAVFFFVVDSSLHAIVGLILGLGR